MNPRPARTPVSASSAQADALRQLHGGGGRPGLSRHRRAARAGPADEAVEAARRPRHLHPALRHRRAVGHVRGRGARRRRAQCRAAPLRKDRARGRGPRLDRSLAGRPEQEARVRMAEGLAVRDPAQRLPPLRQCRKRAGAAAVRHLGAERDEPHRQPDFIFNCPHNFTERFSGADDFFKPKDDIEPDPVRGLAMRRTNFIPDIINCELPLDNRRSPGYRRVEPHDGGQPLLSVDRPARDRPLFQGAQARFGRGAHLRRRARATPTLGRMRWARQPGRTARPTRCCARTTSRSAWFLPRR